MTAVRWPRRDLERDAAKRVDRRLAGAVAAGEVARRRRLRPGSAPDRDARARALLPCCRCLLGVGSARSFESRSRSCRWHRPRSDSASSPRTISGRRPGRRRSGSGSSTVFDVTRRPLAWARQYVFEALALGAVVLRNTTSGRTRRTTATRVAAIALFAAGALVFRRRAPFAAPLVLGRGCLRLLAARSERRLRHGHDVPRPHSRGRGRPARSPTAARPITRSSAVLGRGLDRLHPRSRRPVDRAALAQLPALAASS